MDDHPDTAESFARILRDLGHDAEYLTEPTHVATRVRMMRPHIVLLDIAMPGTDGWDLARLIRRDLGDTVRIVALTGFDGPDVRRRSREAGFDAHIAKPADIALLTNILTQMSDG